MRCEARSIVARADAAILVDALDIASAFLGLVCHKLKGIACSVDDIDAQMLCGRGGQRWSRLKPQTTLAIRSLPLVCGGFRVRDLGAFVQNLAHQPKDL